jgi:hypothetical protein
MDDAARVIATDIVQNAMLKNGWFHFLTLCLAFVGSTLGAFSFAYFRKKGENLATKTDFESILQQVKSTTAATEEIRDRIFNQSITEREFRSLRRSKLEELLVAANESLNWLNENVFPSGSSAISEMGPAYKVSIMSLLYFPELEMQSAKFMSVYYDIEIRLREHEQEINKPLNEAQRNAVMHRFRSDYAPLVERHHEAKREILEAAREIVVELGPARA